jgi:pimeloyl-ACP methyl ester carboxylesterase
MLPRRDGWPVQSALERQRNEHYADDLATLMDALDLKNAVLIGFSAGGGEVARYIGRHDTKRLAKAALVSAVPPLMLKTAANPGGLPMEKFDAIRLGSITNKCDYMCNPIPNRCLPLKFIGDTMTFTFLRDKNESRWRHSIS